MSVLYRPYSLENRAHWPGLIALRTAAPPTDPDDPNWGRWLVTRHLPTPAGRSFRQQVLRTHEGNCGKDRRWVCVDRPTAFCKTAVIADWALDVHSAAARPAKNGFDQQPVVYANANSAMRGAGLFAILLGFCGIPPERTEAESKAQLTLQVDNMGIEFIVVEEAHALRSTTSFEPADTARSMLHLPVTLILSGIDLEHSAVLKRLPSAEAQSSDQMRIRRDPVMFDRTEPGTADAKRRFGRLVREFEILFLRRPGATTPAFTDAGLLNDVFNASLGYPGRLLGCLKGAALDAFADDLVLCPDRIRQHLPATIEPNDTPQ